MLKTKFGHDKTTTEWNQQMIKYIFLPGPNAYTPNVVKETPQYRFEEDKVLTFQKSKDYEWHRNIQSCRASKGAQKVCYSCPRNVWGIVKRVFIFGHHIFGSSFFHYCKVITITDPEKEAFSFEYHPLTLQWILKRMYSGNVK